MWFEVYTPYRIPNARGNSSWLTQSRLCGLKCVFHLYSANGFSPVTDTIETRWFASITSHSLPFSHRYAFVQKKWTKCWIDNLNDPWSLINWKSCHDQRCSGLASLIQAIRHNRHNWICFFQDTFDLGSCPQIDYPFPSLMQPWTTDMQNKGIHTKNTARRVCGNDFFIF